MAKDVDGIDRLAQRQPHNMWLPPSPPSGMAMTGRISKLFVGQGYGFIRLADNREIYFHRADIREGTSINELHVGDVVTLELYEDRVSGARALQVARRQPRR